MGWPSEKKNSGNILVLHLVTTISDRLPMNFHPICSKSDISNDISKEFDRPHQKMCPIYSEFNMFKYVVFAIYCRWSQENIPHWVSTQQNIEPIFETMGHVRQIRSGLCSSSTPIRFGGRGLTHGRAPCVRRGVVSALVFSLIPGSVRKLLDMVLPLISWDRGHASYEIN